MILQTVNEIEGILKAIVKEVGEITLPDKTYREMADNKEKIHLDYDSKTGLVKVYLK